MSWQATRAFPGIGHRTIDVGSRRLADRKEAPLNPLLQHYYQGVSDCLNAFRYSCGLWIDPARGTLTTLSPGGPVTKGLYTSEAFLELSRLWLRIGWSLGYYYQFNWMGLPVLQLPEDLIRLQEAIYDVRPHLIIETGVCHGGSMLFLASLCRILGSGRVIGIDISISDQVRDTIANHVLSSHIALLEGNSTSTEVFDQVTKLYEPGETVMVILDSDHSRAHVRAELELYAPLVTPGSYIIAEDGIMRDLFDVPGGEAAWMLDNPAAAVQDFLAQHPEFRRRTEAATGFGALRGAVTYWTDGWLQRLP